MRGPEGEAWPGSGARDWTEPADRDDAALLSRIALRDREAFACFFQRHHQHAYNLALRITHSPHGAEEAAQEAMVRVWRHAARFKPEGSSGGWWLRIVAREAVRWLREDGPSCGNQPCASLPDPGPQALEDLGQAEILGRLRREIDRLTQGDQRLLALYFGAGMTQAEVGQSLRLPQRTVSRRVTRLVDLLRNRLCDGGPCAGHPALPAGLLAAALTTGVSAPPHSACACLELLEGRATAIRRPPGGPGLAAGALSLLALGLLVLGVSLFGSREPDSRSMGSGSPSPRSSLSPTDATAAESRVRRESAAALQPRVWSFAKGDLREELPRLGPARWGLTTLGLKALCVPQGEEPEWLLPPDRIPPAPFALSVVWRASQEGLSTIQPVWRDGLRMLPFLEQNRKGKLSRYIRELRRHRYLFVDHRVLAFPDAEMRMPWSVLTYERPYPAAQVGLVLRNCVLCEVALCPLGPGELDEAQAGLAQLLKRTDLEVQLHEATQIGAGSISSGVGSEGAGP